MQKEGSIDPSKLDFDTLLKTDNFTDLDFTQKDGQDPLGVNEFIHNNPERYIENHVSTIYTVKYENNIVGYFTLSMSHIGIKDMMGDDHLDVPFPNYPALLLGQLGVAKKYRGNKIGEEICKYCRGIGQEMDMKAACGFLILRTTVPLAKKFYEPYCDFSWKPKEEGKVWMYSKLF
jgi:hypothetical protein